MLNGCRLWLLHPKYGETKHLRNVAKYLDSRDGIMPQETWIFINTAVRTSSITEEVLEKLQIWLKEFQKKS